MVVGLVIVPDSEAVRKPPSVQEKFPKREKIPIVKCQCQFIQAFPFLIQSTSNVACKVKGLRVKYEVIIFKPKQSKVYKEDFLKKQVKLAFTTNNRLPWSNAFWPTYLAG